MALFAWGGSSQPPARNVAVAASLSGLVASEPLEGERAFLGGVASIGNYTQGCNRGRLEAVIGAGKNPKTDVPAFNQLVRDQNIPAVVVKPPAQP